MRSMSKETLFFVVVIRGRLKGFERLEWRLHYSSKPLLTLKIDLLFRLKEHFGSLLNGNLRYVTVEAVEELILTDEVPKLRNAPKMTLRHEEKCVHSTNRCQLTPVEHYSR